MVAWEIQHPDVDSEADGLVGGLFNTAPGSDVSVTLEFRRGGAGDPRDRHTELQPLVDAAVEDVTIRVGRSARGEPYYREELAAHGVDSLLVALVPYDPDAVYGQGYGGAYGGGDPRGPVWAVLRDASDATPAAERGVYAWDLELTVLQRYDGEDREQIEAEYRDEVV